MHPPGVVIANIILNQLNESLLAGKSLAIVTFPLQNAPEALHGTIVNAMSHAGHTLLYPGLHKLVAENHLNSVTSVSHFSFGLDA